MIKRPLLLANWKMRGDRALVRDYAAVLGAWPAVPLPAELLLFPPLPLIAPLLQALAPLLPRLPDLRIGAQDCHAAAAGAHTGDVSAPLLAELGCSAVLVGHSERRAQHGESNAMVAAKVTAAQQAGLLTVLCVGEAAPDSPPGDLTHQLRASLPDAARVHQTVLAYEPVWAIGTGQTPSPDLLTERLAALRAALPSGLRGLPIVYGGSVDEQNAPLFWQTPGLDGLLVGGLSMRPAALVELLAGWRQQGAA